VFRARLDVPAECSEKVPPLPKLTAGLCYRYQVTRQFGSEGTTAKPRTRSTLQRQQAALGRCGMECRCPIPHGGHEATAHGIDPGWPGRQSICDKICAKRPRNDPNMTEAQNVRSLIISSLPARTGGRPIPPEHEVRGSNPLGRTQLNADTPTYCGVSAFVHLTFPFPCRCPGPLLRTHTRCGSIEWA
jgi:hypothetical protein